MSILIAFKFDDTVVLATDSRTMDKTATHVVSDAEQKIFEIAPGVFYGANGYTYFATTQAHQASVLGRGSKIENLRDFAKQLDAALMPEMERNIGILAKDQLAGIRPFHAYALAGTSEGRPDVLVHQFWVIDGRIDCREFSCSELLPGKNVWIHTTRDLGNIVGEATTWAAGPYAAAERFVNHMRAVEPEVGGPTQMACIDRFGARWITPPPATAPRAAPNANPHTVGNLGVNPKTQQLEVPNTNPGASSITDPSFESTALGYLWASPLPGGASWASTQYWQALIAGDPTLVTVQILGTGGNSGSNFARLTGAGVGIYPNVLTSVQAGLPTYIQIAVRSNNPGGSPGLSASAAWYDASDNLLSTSAVGTVTGYIAPG